ncbi:MAG: hypothetical protein K2H16_04685, partial [Prevotella sp.]|nr:hypothetical protein [Prevotella sp.]
SLTSTTENNAGDQRFRSLDGIKDTVPLPQRSSRRYQQDTSCLKKAAEVSTSVAFFSCIYNYRNSGRSRNRT